MKQQEIETVEVEPQTQEQMQGQLQEQSELEQALTNTEQATYQ